MAEKRCTCTSCGQSVEFEEEAMPCEVLQGWLMVSELKGAEAVERYSFCSLVCLKTWLDSVLPPVPDVFVRSMGDGPF